LAAVSSWLTTISPAGCKGIGFSGTDGFGGGFLSTSFRFLFVMAAKASMNLFAHALRSRPVEREFQHSSAA
jgi:hypothetical protein